MAGSDLRKAIGQGARRLGLSLLAGLPLIASAGAVDAARLSNAVAVFSGIDKITGRITTFDVYIGETVQFGALQVTPRVCYSRDDTEAQKITTFVEVEGRTAYGEQSRLTFHVTSSDWQDSDRIFAGMLTALGNRTRAIPGCRRLSQVATRSSVSTFRTPA